MKALSDGPICLVGLSQSDAGKPRTGRIALIAMALGRLFVASISFPDLPPLFFAAISVVADVYTSQVNKSRPALLSHLGRIPMNNGFGVLANVSLHCNVGRAGPVRYNGGKRLFAKSLEERENDSSPAL